VYAKHDAELKDIVDEYKRLNLLCEMNVREQVANLAKTTIVQNAWHRGQELSLHGWVYGISNGLIRDLGVTISGPEPVDRIFLTEPSPPAP
jgi:carbonic anhydrase